MIKKLLLLSAIASVTACQSYSEKSQCDPEKNYIISDPVAMEEYKKLRESGEITSYYTERTPVKPCFNATCVGYDPEKFSFMEKKFSDEKRNGIYTIKTTDNLSDPDCVPKNPGISDVNIKYCYTVKKNVDNKIKSQYKYSVENTNKKVTIIKFVDLKNNKKLYEFSYQIYSTGAIGGPGFGICSPQKINNPDYKFNALFYPETINNKEQK